MRASEEWEFIKRYNIPRPPAIYYDSNVHQTGWFRVWTRFPCWGCFNPVEWSCVQAGDRAYFHDETCQALGALRGRR